MARSWGAAACVVFAFGTACGYAAIDGDAFSDGINLPERSSDTDAGDGGSTVRSNPNPADASADVKTPSTTCAVSGLALCFRFEGVAVDESLAPVAPSENVGITFVDGKEDLAAHFTPTSALRFAPNAVFELPNDAATIEAWIKRENTGADAVVFDDDGRFSLTINAAGNVWCKSGGGAITGTAVVPQGAWAHVACVIDQGTMTAYVNGVADVSGLGAVGTNPTLAAAIGGNSPSGEPFVGEIDSFRVFRTARTAAQIAAAAK